MTVYLHILCISLAIGLLDYILKGAHPYNKLPNLHKGWSWHISFFIFHTLMIVLYSWVTDWIHIIGVLSFINEDVFYYAVKSIFMRRLCWNGWLFKSFKTYLAVIILLNAVLIYVLI